MFNECDGCNLIENTYNTVRNEKSFPKSAMKLIEVVKMRVDCREVPSQDRVEMLVENTYRFSLPGGRGDVDVDGGTIGYKPVVCPHFGYLRARW